MLDDLLKSSSTIMSITTVLAVSSAASAIWSWLRELRKKETRFEITIDGKKIKYDGFSKADVDNILRELADAHKKHAAAQDNK